MAGNVTLPDDFIRMLAHLHRGGQYGYWHMLPARESVWWPAGQPSDLTVYQNEHVYFGVHPTTEIPTTNAAGNTASPMYVRAQKKYIAAVNCLFAELDAKYFNNDIVAVNTHLSSLPVLPSIQVISGGGIHAYWLLKNPYVITDKDYLEAMAYVQRAWSVMVHGEASKDLTRVLRVPGTFNVKYSPPRMVLMFDVHFDRLYDLGDLTIHLPPPLSPPSSHKRSNIAPNGNQPIEDYNTRTRITDLLEQYGYRYVGNKRMLSPYSSSGSAGVTIDDQGNRAFIHHESDPLGDGYWKRPFDIIKVLEFAGNWKAALSFIQGQP